MKKPLSQFKGFFVAWRFPELQAFRVWKSAG
jgi:hypothetical protein